MLCKQRSCSDGNLTKQSYQRSFQWEHLQPCFFVVILCVLFRENVCCYFPQSSVWSRPTLSSYRALFFRAANNLFSSLFRRDFCHLTRLVLMRAEGCSSVKVMGPFGTNDMLERHPLSLTPSFIPLFSSRGRTRRAEIDASLLIRAQSVMQTQRLSATGPPLRSATCQPIVQITQQALQDIGAQTNK